MGNIFPYPGSKGRYSEWIISQFPKHQCYVEVFGGSGGVLFDKEPSTVEVYNDLNDDLVVFFKTLRDSPAELTEYLSNFPYSRSEHQRVATEWFEKAHRPSDNVKRSGWFFFLQYSQYSGDNSRRTGFRTSSHPDIVERSLGL